jgi:hypothetical protein
MLQSNEAIAVDIQTGAGDLASTSPTKPTQQDVTEENANWLSYLTSSWLTPLLSLGSEQPLEFENLPEVIDDVRAHTVSEIFHLEWRQEVQTNPLEPSIFQVLRRVYGHSFMLASAMQLTANGLSVFTPVLLSWLIAFVSKSQTPNPPPLYEGILYALGIFLSAVLQSFFNQSYFRITSALKIILINHNIHIF